MKIQKHNPENASVLLTILLSVVILGISIGSYMNLVASQNRFTARSQAWNSALPVLEAGVEEALTHIHYNSTNLPVNGWSLNATGAFAKERVIGTSKYVVTISPTLPPVIYAYGYVRKPFSTNYIDPPRAVRVSTTNDHLFKKGMVAKGQIDLSGNNIATDSFDSSDTNKSTNGRYDIAKSQNNGDVATNSKLIDSLDVWNANIYGHISTGPGGNVVIGPNGAVGPRNWVDAGNKGLYPGYFTDDMNVSFDDVKEPFAPGLALSPLPGPYLGTNYNYVLASGNYSMSSLSMSGNSGQKMLVTGNAVLYITGDVDIKGNASILIAPGATLQMYVAGANTDFGGNGVANTGGTALNFSYFGLPSNTSVKMSGNAAFVGTIYAPQAQLTLGGGGNDDYDFAGASISNSVKLNGKYKFHYDEALDKFGPPREYVVATWNELIWTEL